MGQGAGTPPRRKVPTSTAPAARRICQCDFDSASTWFPTSRSHYFVVKVS